MNLPVIFSQYPTSTDSTPDHQKIVSTEIGKIRSRKELRFEEDEAIQIAQAIFSDIFENGPFKVDIPQAKESEWFLPSDYRGQNRFWNLVDALAILRWRQREIDEDGWLIADDQDLWDAKKIFLSHATTHGSKLTHAEHQLVKEIMKGSLTQSSLSNATKVPQPTVSSRLNSIMAKSPIITCELESGVKTYRINPNMIKYDESYWNMIDPIKLPEGSEVIDPIYRCYRQVIGIHIDITINSCNRIPNTLYSPLGSCSDICIKCISECPSPCDRLINSINDPNQQAATEGEVYNSVYDGSISPIYDDAATIRYIQVSEEKYMPIYDDEPPEFDDGLRIR